MTCPDCIRHAAEVEAMREELAALRGLVDGDLDAQLVRHFGFAFDMRPLVARLVTMLWQARGRWVQHGVLMDALWDFDVRVPRQNDLSVAVSHARRRLGAGAVEAAGYGDRAYRLTNVGLARLVAVLPPSMLQGST